MIDYNFKYALVSSIFSYPSSLFNIISEPGIFRITSLLQEDFEKLQKDEDDEPVDYYLHAEVKESSRGYLLTLKLSLDSSMDTANEKDFVIFNNVILGANHLQTLHASIIQIINERKIYLEQKGRGVTKTVQLIPQVLFMLDSVLPEYQILDNDFSLDVSTKHATVYIHPYQNTLAISYYIGRSRNKNIVPLTSENLANLLLPKR